MLENARDAVTQVTQMSLRCNNGRTDQSTRDGLMTAPVAVR